MGYDAAIMASRDFAHLDYGADVVVPVLPRFPREIRYDIRVAVGAAARPLCRGDLAPRRVSEPWRGALPLAHDLRGDIA